MRLRVQPLLLLAVPFLGLPLSSAKAQWRVDGAPICTAPNNQLTPTAIPDGAGGALLAWYDYRGGSSDIYAHHVMASGFVDPAWPSEGRALCSAAGGQYSPVVVSDGAGGAIVAWYDDRASSSDIYSQRVRASGTVDPAWPPDGRAVCTASGDQIYPAITSDGAGGAIVVWRDTRGGPDTDIYAQRVLGSGAVDPGWPANGRALCTAPNNQSVPSIASDGAGGAFVAWSDLRNGTHSDIYVQRVRASGAVDPAWPVDGRAICTAAGEQSGPAILADGAGAAIVAWFDYRNGLDADIYAQRVLPTGVVDAAWPAGGRALCTAVGEQYSPVLVSDGVGGAVITWYDYRDDAEPDIYAQRVLFSGAVDPAWPVNGRALCTAAGEQSSPSIAGDGAGGGFVSWFDYRSDPASDIDAHHVLASGALDPAWPESGQPLCSANGSQFSPAVVVDGSGGALVAWTDFRGGVTSDIYAQRVYAGGAVAQAEHGPGPGLALGPVRPNPTRAEATITFELPKPLAVTLDVLDLSGRRVRTLLASRELPTGRHQFIWDGTDASDAAQGTGIYWVRMNAAGRVLSRSLVLLR